MFGGFGKFVKNLPNLPPSKINIFRYPLNFFGFHQLSSSIYHTVDSGYFEHRAILNKSLKNMKIQRRRDKNYSFLFILSLN